MTDIHILRPHTLGLPRARELAAQWVAEAEAKFGLECTTVESSDGDEIRFSRSGVNGQMQVTADRFELNAQLGLLYGAFAKSIESAIEKNLDGLLAQGGGTLATG